MIVFFGIVILLACFSICVLWYNKDGILFFCNYARLGAILWLLAIGLYDLSLSNIYHPTLIINIVSLAVALNFIGLSYAVPADIDRIRTIYSEMVPDKKKSFSYIALAGVMLLGIISFVVNYKSKQLRLFLVNKGVVTNLRLSYFLNAMVVTAILFYYLFRTCKSKKGKLIYLFLCAFSTFLIGANMSRGHILYILTGIGLYELVHFTAKKKRKKISLKLFIIIIVAIVAFIAIFGSVGQARTAKIFVNGTNSMYEMKYNLPTGLTWIYIYLSSSLENISYTLSNQILSFSDYTYFQRLFYPFIKFAANLVGKGNAYVSYLGTFKTIDAVLVKQYGLNVSTFLSDAYADFGYIGIIVYLFFYDLIGWFNHKILVSGKIKNIYKGIIFSIIVQISLWSTFANSVFAIAGFWVNVLIVLLLNYFGRIRSK